MVSNSTTNETNGQANGSQARAIDNAQVRGNGSPYQAARDNGQAGSLPHTSYDTQDQALVALGEKILQAKHDGKRPVVMCASHRATLQTRELLAQAGQGFGVDVTTFASWLENLWSLFGDGRSLVQPAERILLADATLSALAERYGDSCPLTPTPGVSQLLEKCASELLPRARRSDSLSPAEEVLLQALDDYRQRLDALGLIELVQIADAFARNPGLAQHLHAYRIILFGIQPDRLNPMQQTLLESCGAFSIGWRRVQALNPELTALTTMLFSRTNDQEGVTATGAVRVALATGPTAETLLVAQEAIRAAKVLREQESDAGATPGAKQESDADRDSADAGPRPDACATPGATRSPADAKPAPCAMQTTRVVVAARNPAPLFEFCAPLATQTGLACALEARVPFDHAIAGRALLSLIELTDPQKSAIDKLEAADFALNPLSGIATDAAFRIDKMHRMDRLMGRDDVLSDLSSSAPDKLMGVIPLMEEGDFPAAFALLEQHVLVRFAHDEAERALSLQAVRRAQTLIETAQRLKVNPHRALQLLDRIRLSQVSASGQLPDILFTTLEGAADLPAQSVGTVVLCGLNTDIYPVRTPENSFTTLAEKWQAKPTANPLAHTRHLLARVLATATSSIVIERSLNNAQAEPQQPAVAFEEIMDCYRARLNSYDDVHRTLRVPTSLEPYTVQAGEEALVANVRGFEPATHTEALPQTGSIAHESFDLIVLKRPYGGRIWPGLDLSASQIESYLECPYQWFAKRRLGVATIDEGFGALERGTFMHRVLQEFYTAFQGQVGQKVTPQTISQARQIMQSCFSQACTYDDTLALRGNRYTPTNSSEQMARSELLDALLAYLEHEATLLPTFTPTYFEWVYGGKEPYVYAGCNLCGCIDRIDIDEAGHAVVIDYKSSLSDDHNLRASLDSQELALPLKMQALIYAKVVRDVLGLNVVGSVYLNPLKITAAGAIDSRFVGQDSLPFGKSSVFQRCAVPFGDITDFDMLVSESERLVAKRMENLAAGIIKPDPASEDSCTYCPVGNCTHRRSERARRNG